MKLSVDVHNFLQNANVLHEIFLMETTAKNAEQAAAILGLSPKEVAKSIILLIDGQPVNAIIPSNKTVSLPKVKSCFEDCKVKLASSKTTVETTGYVLGATPPVAHKNPLRTLIDKECMGLNVIYTGSGDLNAILKIRPDDLKRITHADILDISE